jgi:hypothetical protein
MDLKRDRMDDIDWIDLAQDMEQRALVNTIIKFRVT